MLLAADISGHNTITNWGAFLGSIDALIVKVTEGVGYTWLGAQTALSRARAAGKLVGAYHFASAGDPVAEADYFLSRYSHQPGEVIVLDWEPSGFTGDADAWGHAWCSRVIAATGVVPMVYLNRFYATQQSQWPRTRSLGCALWAAWYGANNGQPLAGRPSFAPWPDPALWQYTSQGARPGCSGALDLSQFYGDRAAWIAYGTPGGNADMTPEQDAMLRHIYESMTPGIENVKNDGHGYELLKWGAWSVLPADAPSGRGEGEVHAAVQAIAAAVKQGSDPTALANAVVAAIEALPAPQAQQVASLVLAGLDGAKLSVTPQPA